MAHPHCRDLLAELSAYLDDEAAQSVCAKIERHLQSCPDCRAMVNTLEHTVALYRALPAPQLPAGVEERLLRVLHL